MGRGDPSTPPRLIRESLRRLWFRLLASSGVYRRLVFAERPLDAPIPDILTRVAVTVSALAPSQIDAYLAFRSDQDPDQVRHRLAEHWCFAVWHEGAIVHAAWVATGRARVDYLSREIELAPGDAYAYDVFTAPRFRGHGVSPARIAWMLGFLRDRNHRRVLTSFLPDNPSAWRPLEKVGYHRIGTMGFVRIGPWRRDFGDVGMTGGSHRSADATHDRAHRGGV